MRVENSFVARLRSGTYITVYAPATISAVTGGVTLAAGLLILQASADGRNSLSKVGSVAVALAVCQSVAIAADLSFGSLLASLGSREPDNFGRLKNDVRLLNASLGAAIFVFSGAAWLSLPASVIVHPSAVAAGVLVSLVVQEQNVLAASGRSNLALLLGLGWPVCLLLSGGGIRFFGAETFPLQLLTLSFLLFGFTAFLRRAELKRDFDISGLEMRSTILLFRRHISNMAAPSTTAIVLAGFPALVGLIVSRNAAGEFRTATAVPLAAASLATPFMVRWFYPRATVIYALIKPAKAILGAVMICLALVSPTVITQILRISYPQMYVKSALAGLAVWSMVSSWLNTLFVLRSGAFKLYARVEWLHSASLCFALIFCSINGYSLRIYISFALAEFSFLITSTIVRNSIIRLSGKSLAS